MADYVQGRTCNTEYEELVAEIARQEVGSEVSLLALPTYPDSIVYEVAADGGQWIFKALEPHGRDRDAIALEAWSCERSREAGLPAPRILSLDTSCSRFPSSFLMMEKMRGECLERLELPAQDLEKALRDLGSLMRALHEIETPRFGLLDEAYYRAAGVVQGFADSWNDALFGAAEGSLKYLARAEALTAGEVEQVRGLVERESRLADLQPTGGRLLHGDLGLVHVWFDPEKGAISGVIDFGECMSGDPVYDFCDFDLQPHLFAHVIAGYYGETSPPDLHGRIWRYAFARSIPWAAKWHERGHVHVIDWVRRLLETAPEAQ